MRNFGIVALFALSLAACGDRGGTNEAAGGNESGAVSTAENQAANAAANAAAAFPCPLEPDDWSDWAASISALPGPGPAAPLVVSGRARVGAGFRPILDQPEIQGQELTVRLAIETFTGPDPADGWHDVRREFPDPGDLRTVVVRCDLETEVARLTIERPQ